MSIIKFLCGESGFRGYWFGDKPGNEGAFWWRKHLREYDDARTKELASLKKLYNDLAESHAKQVIEIKDLRENYEGMKSHCKYLTEINVFNSCFDNADKAWREQHKIEDGEDFIHWYMRYHACERKDLEDDKKKLKSELLKAKERIAELEDENKTLSQFDER
jgi:DNA repair exonuclease SbcCD ATPase subunit